jgi:hypothetical protein
MTSRQSTFWSTAAYVGMIVAAVGLFLVIQHYGGS